MRRDLIVAGSVICLIGLGMWLGSLLTNQLLTQPKFEPAKQVQIKKKPTAKVVTTAPAPAPKVVKVAKPVLPVPAVNNINVYPSPAPASVPAPVSATIQNNINVYPAQAPTPAPAPSVAPVSHSAPVLLLGQPQAYYNSWGWWLVDPNGGFHCPPVSDPTTWTGGMKVLVQRPNGRTYETWAPACYR